MKQNIANANRIFVDRPLPRQAVRVGATPSLWMLSKDNLGFADTAMRVFLMLCLIASLILSGLKVSGTPVGQPTDTGRHLSLRVHLSNPLPNASFGVVIR